MGDDLSLVVPSRPRTRLSVLVLVSCALHAGLLASLVLPRATAAAASAPISEDERWAGETLLVEVATAADDLPSSPSEATAIAPAAAPLATADPAPAPAPAAPPAAATTAPALAPADAVSPAAAAVRAPASLGPRPSAHHAAPSPRRPSAAAPAGGAGVTPRTFGAEGPPGARSLARSFTRAIAPANQADAFWSSAPPGDAGAVEVALSLDDDGHLEVTRTAESAPPALAALVKRTVALLRGGTYAARGGASGPLVLRLVVRVRDVSAANVQGGDVELDWAFEGGKGHASFLREGGRRVDVTVSVVAR